MTVPALEYVVGEAETLTLMAEVGGVTLFDGAEARSCRRRWWPSP